MFVSKYTDVEIEIEVDDITDNLYAFDDTDLECLLDAVESELKVRRDHVSKLEEQKERNKSVKSRLLDALS